MTTAQEQDVTAPPDDLVARLHQAIADYAKATFDQDEAAFRDVGYEHGPLFAEALALTAENKALIADMERMQNSLNGEANARIAAEDENKALRDRAEAAEDEIKFLRAARGEEPFRVGPPAAERLIAGDKTE